MSKIFLHLQNVLDLMHNLEHYSQINHSKTCWKNKYKIELLHSKQSKKMKAICN
jgi:hypothetical protein